MATTWTEIVNRAKSRVDMSQSDFVDSTDWLEYARDAHRKLYNLLVSKFQEYFLEESDPITIDGDGAAAVPSDFQRLHAVDIRYGSQWLPLKARTLAERSNGGRLSAFSRVFRSIGYRLVKREVRFFPADSAAGQVVKLWYTPLPAKVASLSEDIPVEMEQWSEYLVLEMAIMAAIKEETDIGAYELKRAQLEAKINDEAMKRMLEDPDGIEDVRGDDLDGYGFYREEF